jgi:hypothetical protein
VVTYAGFSDESNLLYELHQRGLQQPLIGDSLHAGDGILMLWSRCAAAVDRRLTADAY